MAVFASRMSGYMPVEPSFLEVQTVGDIHGVGWSDTGSIMSSLTNRCSFL